MTATGGRLATLLSEGSFVVTGEIVPPKGAGSEVVTQHARELVGSIDAVNVTDNPAASAHMSPLAGVRFVAEAGIEPTLQLTCRDRNRLALTSDLLGGWALGARNLLAMGGDPIQIGDHPDGVAVHDLRVHGLVALARRLREEGNTLAGTAVEDPPRFLIGVADSPLADRYDPARLQAKLDAGADFVMTQIVYDVERLGAWADRERPTGLFDRAKVIVGVSPLRSAKQASFMNEKLPGVSVPTETISSLEAAGDSAPAVGIDQAVAIVGAIRGIAGIAGVHLMAMGHDDMVRTVVERAGLFPRPTGGT
ncbi:MAG TPA: methylenetetrahydrofolate reductase [Actinomycetota bacterium]|nr:methylenetetrahydrofolate reductase [Actinomycetota bacterium]